MAAQHDATTTIQCHYDVLSVARDADAGTIKKAHRKLALQWHPDKNPGDDAASEQFRLVQQAYECLSDPAERKWYDQHRDAILKGWSASGGGAEQVSILFDIVPYQYAGCFNGYGNEEGGFFAVYRMVFHKVYEGEEQGWVSEGNIEDLPLSFLQEDFGDADTEWDAVNAFYQSWESFTSCLGFAWADQYDTKEAPNRRVRRAMEDENKKARRNARRERNDDVIALVHFCKRRDPRVKAQRERLEQERRQKQADKAEETKRKKAQAAEARKVWQQEAERAMAEFEEEDRIAGRVRLADLDDDYDYGGGKRGKKGKKKNWKRNSVQEEDVEEGNDENMEEKETAVSSEAEDADAVQVPTADDEIAPEHDDEVASDVIDDAYSEEETESEPEPDIWRCECCRKDFKSEGQMENHMKSKKHKEAFKKFQAKKKKEEEAKMEDLIDELALEP